MDKFVSGTCNIRLLIYGGGLGSPSQRSLALKKHTVQLDQPVQMVTAHIS